MIYVTIAVFALYLAFKLIYIVVPLRGKSDAVAGKEALCHKSVAILVPAHNEEGVILNCISSLKDLDYPNYSVYVINDGSLDNTYAVLDEYLILQPIALAEDPQLHYRRISSICQSCLYPNIYVICKENGGKADALNAGISCCKEDIVVSLDADCLLRQDAIRIMNNVFQNERIIAAGGTVHIIQSIDAQATNKLVFKIKNLIQYQVVQYLNAFYLHKYTQSIFNSLVVISGAYGAFRRDLLIQIKGYRKSVGEDMDLTLKLHQYIKKANKGGKGYVMTYVPQSVCYTECPESFKNLTKQRIRWQKAFIDCTVKYGLKMFWRFKAGVSLFFIFDYLILGTLTSFLFLLVPLYMIVDSRISLLFIVLFSTDYLLGITECFISKTVAARYQYTFLKKEGAAIYVFIFLKMTTFKLLNILFIITGTFSYIVNKNRWNKADRLGRCFSGAVIFPGRIPESEVNADSPL